MPVFDLVDGVCEANCRNAAILLRSEMRSLDDLGRPEGLWNGTATSKCPTRSPNSLDEGSSPAMTDLAVMEALSYHGVSCFEQIFTSVVEDGGRYGLHHLKKAEK